MVHDDRGVAWLPKYGEKQQKTIVKTNKNQKKQNSPNLWRATPPQDMWSIDCANFGFFGCFGFFGFYNGFLRLFPVLSEKIDIFISP